MIAKTAKRQKSDPKKERRVPKTKGLCLTVLLAETFYPEDSEDKDNLHHRHIRKFAKQVNAPCHDETRFAVYCRRAKDPES